ncbi:hypothetical protein FGO68_gene17451 [Halteria grandinella]|uniref:Uncharacterized protein n=1 Tax=Halteria grandinella TaxID=5974 RepID=A0A8J8NIA1_HALGN|nr:hypothetical protein FGO68_gene17451 [Halteria grandinella]
MGPSPKYKAITPQNNPVAAQQVLQKSLSPSEFRQQRLGIANFASSSMRNILFTIEVNYFLISISSNLIPSSVKLYAYPFSWLRSLPMYQSTGRVSFLGSMKPFLDLTEQQVRKNSWKNSIIRKS